MFHIWCSTFEVQHFDVQHFDVQHFDVQHFDVQHFDVPHFDVRHSGPRQHIDQIIAKTRSPWSKFTSLSWTALFTASLPLSLVFAVLACCSKVILRGPIQYAVYRPIVQFTSEYIPYFTSVIHFGETQFKTYLFGLFSTNLTAIMYYIGLVCPGQAFSLPLKNEAAGFQCFPHNAGDPIFCLACYTVAQLSQNGEYFGKTRMLRTTEFSGSRITSK
jgi:hypothetical protein